MKLRKVSIAGYRSIREPLDLALDGRVTVLLGANDHGKTNVLEAIRHLNEDHPFDPEIDLNWDVEKEPDNYPSVEFLLTLDAGERAELLRESNGAIRLAAIAEFRETLEEEANFAIQELMDARSVAAKVNERVTELESAEPADATAPSMELTEARHERDKANEAAEEAERLERVAEGRAALGQAEEMKVQADVAGEDAPDFAALAEEARAAAAKAATNAKSAATRSETAAQNLEQAKAAVPEDADAVAKAESDAEQTQERAAAQAAIADAAQTQANELTQIADAVAAAESGELSFADGAKPPHPKLTKIDAVPGEISLSRTGVTGELVSADIEGLERAAVEAWRRRRLPRVELISAQERLPDAATPETIDEEDHDFMRGIFRYAGLEPEEWEDLFEHNDTTSKRLDNATNQLNSTLREAWSQGQELKFLLDHHGDGDEIWLRISDPAVANRFVRASRRSSGFTHFFALKTMLYARERESDASSFIWLFDEPGIFLHPQGQHDLLQVLETLARTNQIIYSTHSIFLINKNYPTRHRLLKKDAKGTGIDLKPYSGRWQAAIEALGLALPGTFLFASKVLLVEGDSDPILLGADLQRLIELGDFTADINSLSVMGTGESKHTDALIRILHDSALKPDIALLFDGDQGGNNRRKNLKKIIDAYDLSDLELDEGTTLEDHLLAPELFREAAILYAISIGQDTKDATKIRSELEKSWKKNVEGEGLGEGEEKMSLAKWSRDETKRILKLDEPPSSVGIAREYSQLVLGAEEESLPKEGRKRAIALAKKIEKKLKLPSQLVDEGEIVERP